MFIAGITCSKLVCISTVTPTEVGGFQAFDIASHILDVTKADAREFKFIFIMLL